MELVTTILMMSATPCLWAPNRFRGMGNYEVVRTIFPLLLLFAMGPWFALSSFGENYAGEIYLLNLSVPLSGTARTMPSFLGAPSEFLEFPASFQDQKKVKGEIASMPLFGDLSSGLYGAVSMPLQNNIQISAYGAMVVTNDIGYRPVLDFESYDNRRADPTARPEYCERNCREFRNAVYMAYLNAKKQFRFEFPRLDYFSAPLPMELTLGTNIKYFKDELEGAEYIAQNINMDAALNLRLELGYNPIEKNSHFDLVIEAILLELLQTSLSSNYNDEPISSRYHLAMFAEKKLPQWNSRAKIGVHQKSEWSKYPGWGAEWIYRDFIGINAGYHSGFISGGMFLKYQMLSLFYSLNHHDLGFSPYQISLQVEAPCCNF